MFEHSGTITWLTGLPASGKTSIANTLYHRLKAGGARVQVLDDDIIRAMTCGTIGYTREDRAKHMMQVANAAKMLADHGIFSIIAVTAPYRDIREVLFVAGLPKSGTTWMSKLLGMIPGYYERTIYDPSRLMKFHDISPTAFELMPHYAHSVIKLHTKYSSENFAIIQKYLDKIIVMYRDLRDMTVSRYFHILSEESHRHHHLYKEMSQEDGILHSMNIVRRTFVSWVKDWHEVWRWPIPKRSARCAMKSCMPTSGGP